MLIYALTDFLCKSYNLLNSVPGARPAMSFIPLMYLLAMIGYNFSRSVCLPNSIIAEIDFQIYMYVFQIPESYKI